MNKELKALEKIDHTICLAFNDNNKALFNRDNENHIDCRDIYEFIKCYKILETALHRLEEHDRIFKKYDINDNWLEPTLYVIKNHFPMDTETQLKKFKALDIIKEKQVSVADFIYACMCSTKDLKEYHNCDSNYEFAATCVGWGKEYLTQEEYELLKEVLLCKK